VDLADDADRHSLLCGSEGGSLAGESGTNDKYVVFRQGGASITIAWIT
jgi:hypothetical protein